MAKRRSISEKINYASTLNEKLDIALEWALKWEEEQLKLLDLMGRAVASNDFDMQCKMVGQLKEVSRKKFAALSNVIEKTS